MALQCFVAFKSGSFYVGTFFQLSCVIEPTLTLFGVGQPNLNFGQHEYVCNMYAVFTNDNTDVGGVKIMTRSVGEPGT